MSRTIHVPRPEQSTKSSTRRWLGLVGMFTGEFTVGEKLITGGERGWTAIAVGMTNLATADGSNTHEQEGQTINLEGRRPSATITVAMDDMNNQAVTIGSDQLGILCQALDVTEFLNEDGSLTVPDDPEEILAVLQQYRGTPIKAWVINRERNRGGSPVYRTNKDTGAPLTDENGERIPVIDDVIQFRTKGGRIQVHKA